MFIKDNKVRLNTLQKIENELDNQFRLSRDLIFDLRATKVLCGNLKYQLIQVLGALFIITV